MAGVSDSRMCLAHSQTVEDTEPNRWPEWTLIHQGTTFEYVREEVGVRRPYALTDFDRRLVVRHSQASTRVTCALEGLRVE
jgi:hypothetical protein